jgi:succinate-semialdehyde dehydrogenase/glutarate-semialdehyde dehydrogenase
MAQEYSQHQTEPHSTPDADNGRPLFKVYNPATGQFSRAYHGHSREEALAIARRAHEAFREWRRVPFGDAPR